MLNKFKQQCALRYYNKSIGNVFDYEDFLQEAELAELKAKRGFIPSKGEYEPYARKTIQNELLKKALTVNSVLSVKNNAAILAINIFQLEILGYSDYDIIKTLDISEKRLQQVKNILTRQAIQDNDLVYNNEQNQINLHELYSLLTSEDQNILRLYLSTNNLYTVADHYGNTYEWARRKIKKILSEIGNKYE